MAKNPSLSPRQKLIKEVKLSLGDGIVDIELTPDHYDLAFDMSLDTYRQKSQNSTEERMAFLDLQRGQQDYFLPPEVIEVTEVMRRGVAGTAGGGAYFEPFAASFAAQFVMTGTGDAGDLVTFELFSEYQNLIGTMFGQYITFFWHQTQHKLSLQRDIRDQETVLLHIFCYRPEEVLLQDTYARPWLRRMTIAQAKLLLGQVRSLFGSFPGPQGGVVMNGPALIQEAQAEIALLTDELRKSVDNSEGYFGVIHG